jgi:protein YIPF5/7
MESIPFQQPDMQFQQFQYTSTQDYTFQPQIDIPTTVTFTSIRKAFSASLTDDETPLLQELGINFSHIFQKTYMILNPLRIDSHFVDDTDLAGPLLFCFLIAGFLLLSGKAHFGYIYGVAMVGCLFMYAILNVMSSQSIQISQTASILGYALLPIVLLSSISIIVSLSYYFLM